MPPIKDNYNGQLSGIPSKRYTVKCGQFDRKFSILSYQLIQREKFIGDIFYLSRWRWCCFFLKKGRKHCHGAPILSQVSTIWKEYITTNNNTIIHSTTVNRQFNKKTFPLTFTLIGVCIDTSVIYQSVLKKRPIGHVYRKRRNIIM